MRKLFGRKKNSEGAAALGQTVDVVVIDETHETPESEIFDWMRSILDAPRPVRSKLRIRFNRALTWAEREAVRGFMNHLGYRHHFNHEDPSELHLRAQDDSRTAYDVVAHYVAEEFVNVYPKAVRTFVPQTEV